VSVVIVFLLCVFECDGVHRDLHSCPTRRSSVLVIKFYVRPVVNTVEWVWDIQSTKSSWSAACGKGWRTLVEVQEAYWCSLWPVILSKNGT